MLGRLRIRGKLALVVALPLLGLALLTIPGVAGAADRAGRAEEIEDSMRVASRVTSLVSELRQERLLSLGYLLGAVDRSQLVAQSTRVSDRLADIGHQAQDGELGGGGLPGPVADALDGARGVAELRAPVLERAVPIVDLTGGFGAAITGLIDSLRLLDGVDLATPAARQVAALDAALRANEAASQAIDLLLVASATDPEDPVAQYQIAAQYAGTLRLVDDHLNRFGRYATPEQAALVELMSGAYTSREVTGAGVAFEADPQRATAGRSPAEVFPSLASLNQLSRFVETKVITDVLIEVEAQGRAELRTAYLVALGAVLVVLAVVVLTATLARAVVRPLLGLTASANRMAQVADAELARIADEEEPARESPEPVRLDPAQIAAQDEIGDLGRAFDRVQATAVQLVERQVASRRNVALMFGYLGRRTQNLVGRQVDLIDQLERNETDPGRLADLYRLDHLTSRLGRNAGSLVVLSGSTGADEHVAPLPLADIVRLALGEIEDFGRVDVDVPASVAVAPAAVGDLVLMLAELMENATTFSPPHTRVTVSAAAGGSGMQVSVVDRGIGMPEARLAEENARLARRERLEVAPTEVLGLFVVGRLARRHGMTVLLSSNPDGGITAVLEIDQRLLLPAVPLPAPPAAALPPAPAPPGHSLVRVASAALGPELIDLEALTRASLSLAAGRSWNAFAVPRPSPAGPTTPAEGGGAAEATEATELAHRNGDGSGPAGRSTLRRRVPGASLGAAEPLRTGARPGDQPTLNPDEARDLVEQLQSGVARALGEIRGHDRSEAEEDHDDR